MSDVPDASLTVIGMLSGTSADAIDAAVVVVRQSGTILTLKLLGYIEYPFRPETHERLLALLTGNRASVADVCELNRLLAEEFAQTAHAAVRVAGISMDAVDLIASHGQTVYHQVRHERLRSTLQIGAPAVLAERTGRTVVADFRTRDVAAGGHGAPLAPYLDKLLWADPQQHRALQNIGGIANVTFIPAGAPDDLLAFDTGPGNVLIDQAARLLSSGRMSYDHDGSWAAQGRIDKVVLAGWLDDPFFKLPPPKTTGRERYSQADARSKIATARQHGLSDADIMATITALTAVSISAAYRNYLPQRPNELILSGGGAHNKTLVQMLTRVLPDVTLRYSEELGLPGDAKEALLFAVLGYAALYGWPTGTPRSTGAKHAVLQGSITPGDNYLALMRRVSTAPHVPATRAVLESDDS